VGRGVRRGGGGKRKSEKERGWGVRMVGGEGGGRVLLEMGKREMELGT